ncbi:hypothetical protein T492DRAFT_969368 [Pavlovales sp. CCMP2436]|nr:hypothetical protein T492DRAFT_969368 [Pavlovales sp. CCMP2436]
MTATDVIDSPPLALSPLAWGEGGNKEEGAALSLVFGPPGGIEAEGGALSLSLGTRAQREQQLATSVQAAIRLGSLSFALATRTASRCRRLAADLALDRAALEQVRGRADLQHSELRQLRGELRFARDESERDHASLRAQQQQQEVALETMGGVLASCRARLQEFQRRQQLAGQGAVSCLAICICAGVISSPVVSAPMAVVSALVHVLAGKRTRSAAALLAALRLAIFAYLFVRVRRGAARLPLFLLPPTLVAPGAPPSTLFEPHGSAFFLHELHLALAQLISSSRARWPLDEWRTWLSAADPVTTVVEEEPEAPSEPAKLCQDEVAQPHLLLLADQ